MRIILVCFAGREANLEVQRPFIDRILETYPTAEMHYWDLTRTPEDAEYLRSLDGAHEGRVSVLGHLHPGHPIRCKHSGINTRTRCGCIIHKPPYEKPYEFYAGDKSYSDAVFVKLDDDVLFMETDRFGDLLDALEKHPSAVVSANVVNNVVCAKHDPVVRELAMRSFLPATNKDWWWLHTEPEFARLSHEWFLANWSDLTQGRYNVASHALDRSLPGEFVSINMIAFTHPTMRRISAAIGREGRLGDEGAVDRLLPRIASTFRAAHLTFGPQDKAMKPAELDVLRARYAAVAKEYLG